MNSSELSAVLRMADMTLGGYDARRVRELATEALGYGRGRLDAANGGRPYYSDAAIAFAFLYARNMYDAASGAPVRHRPIYLAWDDFADAGRVTA